MGRQNSLDLRSNAFGTVNGAFTAPSGGLTGRMSLRGDNLDGSASFNVEEYKRPKFETTFKPMEGAYRLNETVTVRGEAKNYAGSVVDGAQLRYRVVRQARFPYWGWSYFRKPMPWSSQSMEITSGETTTKADGSFEIQFQALPDREIPVKDQPVFDYTIYADVTDISGETRSGEQTLSIGYVALEVNLGMENANHLFLMQNIGLSTTNLAGQPQVAMGEIKVQRLKSPDQLYAQRYWEKPDQWLLKESEFKLDFPDFAWQQEDEPDTWAAEGKAQTIPFNTKDQKTVDLSGTYMHFTTIDVAESDRGGITVHAFAVWKNRVYLRSPKQLNVPWTNKDLDIKFETFRDKMEPGQAEEWRLRISGPQKERVAAEMVAAMYDASLDQFLPHSWQRIAFPSHYAQVRWQSSGVFGQSSANMYNDKPSGYEYLPDRVFQSLNWFDFPLYGGRYFGNTAMYRSKAMPDEAVMMMDGAPSPAPQMEEMVVAAADSMVSDEPGAQTEDTENENVQKPAAPPSSIRTNLNETVFFFPELQTDADGSVVVKFKMNEALTRWKFLAFAHTADLQNALAEKEVVTQKDLMVMVNAPRFLRAGDVMEFAAKVSNLTDAPLSGTATLSLLDAVTLQPLETQFSLNNADRVLQFTAPALQSAPLRWTIRVPEDFSGAITWQVFADTKSVRDGEESTIPVVTNRMLVTESMPITVRGNQTKTFVFEDIKKQNSSTLVSHRYTLEFTSNPAWYVVQSLPYLMEYPHECSEQIFSRFYANTLASSVTQKMPNIRKVYDRWKGTDAMKSNLSKNQDLKYALLEETPWVFDAQSEELQRQNIALLFDLNRMADERERALSALSERQNSSGGWSWFPGGPDQTGTSLNTFFRDLVIWTNSAPCRRRATLVLAI
ncbi:MAG: hypothetical protein IPL65_12935 [Lewinellaceae bacterium]|nr:hypothetical protein [Lewinellaceae bacterium]